MNKEMLLWLLKTHYTEVVFTKKDGTKRQMLCTLQKDSIPEVDNIKEKPDGLITVWDVEKKAWRSFYMNSILTVHILTYVGIYRKEV